jgi:hypothetical protein
MADPELGTFDGWTDDTFWNGWLNVEVDPETHYAILGRSAAAYGVEHQDRHPANDTDASYAVGLSEALSGIEQLTPNDSGRYSYAYCYCTREALTPTV